MQYNPNVQCIAPSEVLLAHQLVEQQFLLVQRIFGAAMRISAQRNQEVSMFTTPC